MRSRHNTIILECIRKAIPPSASSVLIDQKIPDSPGSLRPDIVNIRDSNIFIFDLTVPYESGADAFSKARAGKITKYSHLINWARSRYSIVSFCLIVIGSLGSWDPEKYPEVGHWSELFSIIQKIMLH